MRSNADAIYEPCGGPSAAWAGGFMADSLVHTSRNRTAPLGRYSFTRQVQGAAATVVATEYTGAAAM